MRSSISYSLISSLKKYWLSVIKETRYPEDISDIQNSVYDGSVYVFGCYYIFGRTASTHNNKMDICIIAEMMRSYIIAVNEEDKSKWLAKITEKLMEK